MSDMTTPLTPDPSGKSPDYNRGWADGQAAALDACQPVIDKLQAALRAASPDPAEPTGFRPGMVYGNGGNVLPDRSAEPGLPWTVESDGDDRHILSAPGDNGTVVVYGDRKWADLLARAALSDTARTEGLDTAWSEAEAALLGVAPEDAVVEGVSWQMPKEGGDPAWGARAYRWDRDRPWHRQYGFGDTPAAALRALAARLAHPKDPA